MRWYQILTCVFLQERCQILKLPVKEEIQDSVKLLIQTGEKTEQVIIRCKRNNLKTCLLFLVALQKNLWAGKTGFQKIIQPVFSLFKCCSIESYTTSIQGKVTSIIAGVVLLHILPGFNYIFVFFCFFVCLQVFGLLVCRLFG